MRFAALLVLVVACGGDAATMSADAGVDAQCTAGTVAGGPTISCTMDDGTSGICVRHRVGGDAPKCFVSPCPDGSCPTPPGEADYWWWTIAVSDGPPVCYCGPRPH